MSDLMGRLEAIEGRVQGLTALCAEHLRQSIRHVQRNCDIDCNVHEDETAWGSCYQPDRGDGDRMAAVLADVPYLLALVRSQHAQLDKVRDLHKPEKRWTHPYWTGSFDTRDEAAEYDYDEAMGDDQKSQVGHFEICAECGRIESEQLSEAGDGDWSYRESLWPCKTAAAITDHLGEQ